VVLTLANETGLLPLDMPEIQIKRRLYRSGESEYYINSTQVKLKDIRQLFWDTGVGKAAYSVMEQGKIDQVLSSKPDERRYLFEEAAGITKFKIKSAEAERKLLKTEENMRQVEGILGEVKRTYDSLKTQSDKTMKYRTLKENIFHFELDIQLIRLKNFNNERDQRNVALKKRTEDRDKIRGDLDAISKSLEENMDAVNVMEAQLVDYQKNIYGLMVEKNAREKEVKGLAQQRGEVKNKISQNEGREHTIAQKIEDLIEDADAQDLQVRDLRKKVGDKQAIVFYQNEYFTPILIKLLSRYWPSSLFLSPRNIPPDNSARMSFIAQAKTGTMHKPPSSISQMLMSLNSSLSLKKCLESCAISLVAVMLSPASASMAGLLFTLPLKSRMFWLH
jgi:chromosome segregation protein